MGKKQYRARVTIDGRQIHLGYFDTAKERKLAEAEALANAKETVLELVKGGERFQSFAERTLLAHKRRVTDSTWHNYMRMYRLWLLPTFGKKRLRDITVRDVDRWFNALPDAPSNAQRYAVLSLIMRRAVKEGEIDRSPCMAEGVSAIKSAKRPTWSWKDFNVLLDATATDQERALLWLLAGTGMRIGEALALNREDVDAEYGEVTVSKHLGRKGEMIPGTKAHPDQVRVLALPQQALEALMTHHEARGGFPEDPLFVSSRGGRLSHSVASMRFKSLRESRLLEEFHLHDLRHLHLTEYAKHASLAEGMAHSGHSDVRSWLRYQHTDRARDRAIMRAMERAL